MLRYTKGEQVVQREGEWGERVSQEGGGEELEIEAERQKNREADKDRERKRQTDR